MAASSAKRPARKTAPKRAEPEATLVDPETVEKVRAATAALMRTFAGVGSSSGRALLDGLVAAGVWVWPRLRDGSIAVFGALGRGIAGLARWSWDRRSGLARVGQRLMWWTALAILVLVGQALLAADGDPELVALSLMYLSVGLSLSLFVMLSAPETRMRLASLALAGGHGSLGALAMVAGLSF